jgi:hypothetical protein
LSRYYGGDRVAWGLASAALTSGDEERLRLVEVDAAHGAVVLVEAVQQRAHSVVPQLNDTVVQRRQDPRPHRVKGQAFHPITLALELSQHCCSGWEVCWVGVVMSELVMAMVVVWPCLGTCSLDGTTRLHYTLSMATRCEGRVCGRVARPLETPILLAGQAASPTSLRQGHHLVNDPHRPLLLALALRHGQHGGVR